MLQSEWIKLRTLRSTWLGLGAVLAVLAGLGVLAAAVSSGSVAAPEGGGGPGFGGDDPLSTVLTGSTFAVLLVGVLGCLAGAREYGSRMITATFAAVPRRWPVVLAKAAVLIAVVLPVALVGVLVAYAGGMAALGAADAPTVALSDDGVVRTLLGMAGYLTAIALLGLGLGLLLRSVAASIGTLVGVVLVVPALAGALLPDGWDAVVRFLPTNAGAAFTAVQATSDDLLGAGLGAVTVALWVLALLAAATAAVVRRDV